MNRVEDLENMELLIRYGLAVREADSHYALQLQEEIFIRMGGGEA